MTARIWFVYGTDTNIFGDPKRRKVEVAANTEAEAIAEAIRHFPDLTVTEAWPTTHEATA